MDLIDRQTAIELVKDVCDAIMSGCESWYDPETEDEVYADIREVDAILKCNKEVRIALRNMPPAQPDSKDLIKEIKNGITVSDGNSEYFVGLRNGMRWCLSLIDGKEPIYESLAQTERHEIERKVKGALWMI